MDYGYGNIDNLRRRIVLANNKKAAKALAIAASHAY
jgi:hypothetical protein